jgi:hypothetical protein
LFSSEDLSEYKIAWSYVDWCKFLIHLKRFGMVAATALRLGRRDNLQWHKLPTEFHKNVQIGSKVDIGEQIHWMVISLAYFFSFSKESRLIRSRPIKRVTFIPSF